ncbi:MAG: ComEC/Rec2 family competence protein, partial [Myxococcota bacterium]
VLRRTGTSHLLSISGFHVGAAAALAAALAGRSGRAAAGAQARGVSAPELAVAVGAAWAYTALAAWPIPAERAAATVTAALAARSRGRITAPGPVLAAIGAALALVDPGAPWSASYQLSFGALAGLLLLGPRLSRWVPPTWPWVVRSALGACVATIGATAGTLPVAAWWFQAVPPLGPLANLVAMPTLGLALVPVAGVAAFAPDPLAAAAAHLGTAGAGLILAALEPMAVDPWTPAVGPLGAAGLAVAVGLVGARPALGLALGAAALGWPRARPHDLRVTMLDVGQGDAVLIEDRSTRVLIDGGRAPHDVARWLRRVGIRRLDVVVQSHPDLDHAGGLVAVVRELRVGELWAVDLDPALGAAAITRGVPIRPPPEALWPAAGARGSNDRSVVLGWGPLLATGDAGRAAEVAFAGALGRFPLVKLGHHGSSGSTSDALLDAAAPRLALLSVGRDNPYGHPARDVLTRLERRGVPVLRTDVDGTITVEVTPTSWRARGSTRAEVR